MSQFLMVLFRHDSTFTEGGFEIVEQVPEREQIKRTVVIAKDSSCITDGF